jgi:serine protease AprX
LVALVASLTVGSAVYAAPRPVHGTSGSRAARKAALVAKQATVQAAKHDREFRGVPDDGSRQLDRELRRRANRGLGRSRVIIELKPGWETSASDVRAFGGKLGRRLRTYNGQVVELSDAQLKRLAKHPAVLSIHHDRPIYKHNNRTAVTTGARTAQLAYGYTGAGIGVAVIDSGVTGWHDDLMGPGVYPYGNQRVAKFVDFVNGQPLPYDDNGHGTHVAGTILGNGHDSYGFKAGMAPGAHLIALKVLDGNGNGTISNIIAALDYAVANKNTYNIRVINMSIGASIQESFTTDPLTLAAKRAADAGIVVVTAAGNLGRGSNGQTRYGSVTAPGNAPWVLTVGASSSMGTVNRTDDEIARYSSRGPTYIDYTAKPDLVAPGTGTISLVDPMSLFFAVKSQALVAGYLPTAQQPYLSLSGTSMAAPAVAGSVALMLEANPALTPNLVKAILQYTAQVHPDYNALTQGAGFLNTMGAIEMARAFANHEPGAPYPNNPHWSHHIFWGNHRLTGGVLLPTANAWDDNIVWGSALDGNGDNIVWGSAGGDYDNIVWGSADDDNIVWGSSADDNIVWGSSGDDNIVWGSNCADPNCDNIVWGSSGGDDNIVWGSDCGGADCDNIVWGSSGGDDNIVWGSSDYDNIVWGSSNGGDNIVWGSSGDDNIVWGSSDYDNIVWGSSDYDNIVWGSSGDDNIVWGSNGGDNIVWGSTTQQQAPVWPDEADFSMADPAVWPSLFVAPNSQPPVDSQPASGSDAPSEVPPSPTQDVPPSSDAPAPGDIAPPPDTTQAPTDSQQTDSDAPTVPDAGGLL